MKILLAGGDAQLTQLTGKILRRHRYDVRCAALGEELPRALEGTAFSLVILDCDPNLSDGERKRLLGLIRAQRGRPRVLVLSGNGEDEIPCLNDGADDWIKKPYYMDVLLARMSALLRQEQTLEAATQNHRDVPVSCSLCEHDK